MVERVACSNETNKTTLNGEARLDVEGASVDVGRNGGVSSADVARVVVEEKTSTLARGNAGFSLFRWFKRSGPRERRASEKRRRTLERSKEQVNEDGRRRSVSSSAESIDTFYSTTTVRSFAFQTGTLGRCSGLSLDILRQAAEVGPFAAGASKLAVVTNKENVGVADVACTLPTNVHSRRRDITARYSLQPSTTFNSCGNLPTPERRLTGSLRRHDERVRIRYNNGSARRRVHVKGKRRAPDPPGVATKIAEVDARDVPRSSNRRKRRAPRPPERIVADGREDERALVDKVEVTEPNGGGMDVERRDDAEEGQTISNDTLVLQGGVLLSKREIRGEVTNAGKDSVASTGLDLGGQESSCQSVVVGTLNAAMPRPWYKRSVFEHSRDSGPSRRSDILRGPSSSTVEIKEECAGSRVSAPSAAYSVDASLSRLSFFHRGGDKQGEDRRKEAKRKSGLSILTNISELDKEAAAIVQEEQARARASMLLQSSRFADDLEKRNNVNEEIVQNMVTSAIETSSPRRGTRALISKFNAISNITKVTVNANFFARGSRDQKVDREPVKCGRLQSSKSSNAGKEQNRFALQRDNEPGVRADKDISRYFLPQQRSSRIKDDPVSVDKTVVDERIVQPRESPNDQLAAKTSDRISFLQSQLAANRINEPVVTIAPEVAVPVMEERIRLRQEVVEKRTNRGGGEVEGGKKYLLLARPGTSAESQENALAVDKVSRRGKEGPDVIQREFSDIFDEIDKQLRTKEFNLINRHGPDRSPTSVRSSNTKEKAREDEAISNKVTKVLDILVEAEKDGRSRMGNLQPQRSILIEDTSFELINSNAKKVKPSKTNRSPVLNRIEDPLTADLKEMLKEMKHSLPKRPKPKKSTVAEDEAETKVHAVRESPLVANRSPHLNKPRVPRTQPATGSREDHEPERQKVSSSAQTSGNLRRLNEPSISLEGPSTSGWKQEDVLYRTGKSGLGSGLVKNAFQLIRPRDFAEIEATKTAKGAYKENTYANVIQQSLYANAHVAPPSPKQASEESTPSKDSRDKNPLKLPKVSPVNERKPIIKEERFDDAQEGDASVDKNMNTLAINRLLRKLEAAIASGHHQQAAGLAKELARLKIHCSVVRQRSARLKDQSIKVNMYIEDKLAHQGPIPLQLPTKMTVAELKTKVHTEFEIPTNVQRWIIGKNLADQDEATLDKLQAVDGSPVFLYLVAPELHGNETTVQVDKPAEETSKIIDQQHLISIAEEKLENLEKQLEVPEDEEEKKVEEEQTSEEVKMERYEELISLENCDVIPNSEPIECPICFLTYGPREGVILRDCLHMFCKPCLSNTILYCEEAEVKCPYRDTEYTCESTLQEREIKALVEPEVYQQHLAKSIAQAENNAGNNAFHCKTPDCPGWCIYDDDVNNFLCPVCGVNNCLTCQVVHTGKNCRQYQQELRFSKETDQESRRTAAMLEEMVDRGEALACPTCAVVLIKKWGCDWLRCSMCKTEICWVTRGPRWGPAGKGDTSGGCRCGENGVKCHPRCNYCH